MVKKRKANTRMYLRAHGMWGIKKNKKQNRASNMDKT